eukprot:scaffold158532_cov28-Tisochrysis_lutea.AAC.3
MPIAKSSCGTQKPRLPPVAACPSATCRHSPSHKAPICIPSPQVASSPANIPLDARCAARASTARGSSWPPPSAL